MLLVATEDGHVHALCAEDGGEAAGSPLLTTPGVRLANAPRGAPDSVAAGEAVAVLLHDRYRLWMLDLCAGGVAVRWTVRTGSPPPAEQRTANHDPENLPPLPAIVQHGQRVEAFRDDGTVAALRASDGALLFTGTLAAVSGAAAFAGERSAYLGGLRAGGYDLWELNECGGAPETQCFRRVLAAPLTWVARTRAALLLAAGGSVAIVQDTGVIRLTPPDGRYWQPLGVISVGGPHDTATAGDDELLLLGEPLGRLHAVRVADGATVWAADTVFGLSDPHRLRLAGAPAAAAPFAAGDGLIAVHSEEQLVVMDAATGANRRVHRWPDRRILDVCQDGAEIDLLLSSLARAAAPPEAGLHRLSDAAGGAAPAQWLETVELPEGCHAALWRPNRVTLVGRTRVHSVARPSP